MASRRKVSILMPVRNGLPFLPTSRKHIEANTSQDDEIIIVDDGSSDGSEDFLRKWSRDDQRVVLINSGGVGLVDSLNMGIKTSSNEWIARFDVDDEYDSNRLHLQVCSIENNDVAIFSDYNFIGEEGNQLGIIPTAVFPNAVAISLISAQRTPHPSVLFSKSAVLEVGSYRISDYLVEDLSLWLRLNTLGNMKSIPETLLKYRIHKNGTSYKNRSLMLSSKDKILQEIKIPQAQVDLVLEDLPKIFEQYDHFSFSNERKLLLLRELRTLGILESKLISQTIKSGFTPKALVHLCYSGIKLVRDVQARNKYRFN